MSSDTDNVFRYTDYLGKPFNIENYKIIFQHIILQVKKVIQSYSDMSIVRDIRSDDFFPHIQKHVVAYGLKLLLPDNTEKWIKITLNFNPQLICVSDKEKIELLITSYTAMIREEIGKHIDENNGIKA